LQSLISFALVEMACPRKVALYARGSTKGQRLDNQLAELHAVYERNAWAVVQVFTDFGISGTKGRSRRSRLDASNASLIRPRFGASTDWAGSYRT
jgi:predicted site-specific integrase-resolvase